MVDGERVKMTLYPAILVIAKRRAGHGVVVRVHLFKQAGEPALRIGSGEYFSPNRIRSDVLPMWKEVARQMRWQYHERVPDELRERGR